MDEFLKGPVGRVVGVSVLVIALVAAAWSIWSCAIPDAAMRHANERVFINAETNYVFRRTLVAGMTIPVVCPDTGKATGYVAEFCTWTKNGHVKAEGTPVLLNQYRGKPEPTFCPDCGRLVVANNPPANETRRPPPTEEEYRAWAGQADQSNGN